MSYELVNTVDYRNLNWPRRCSTTVTLTPFNRPSNVARSMPWAAARPPLCESAADSGCWPTNGRISSHTSSYNYDMECHLSESTRNDHPLSERNIASRLHFGAPTARPPQTSHQNICVMNLFLPLFCDAVLCRGNCAVNAQRRGNDFKVKTAERSIFRNSDFACQLTCHLKQQQRGCLPRKR